MLCDGVTGWTGGQTETQTSSDLRTDASTRVLDGLWPKPTFLGIPQRQELPSPSSDAPWSGEEHSTVAYHRCRQLMLADD